MSPADDDHEYPPLSDELRSALWALLAPMREGLTRRARQRWGALSEQDKQRLLDEHEGRDSPTWSVDNPRGVDGVGSC